MESVKKENERIMKAQEELNQILIEKLQTEERSRRSESEDVTHQRRSKKMKLVKNENNSSSEGLREQQSYYTTSDSSEAELYNRKKKYMPYEEISGEFKKIKKILKFKRTGMEKLGEYAQEESPDTETRQLSRVPMLEEVTAHSSELLQTVKDLKTEMESVKKENERILKAQEELNHILMEKFQTEGRSRRSESEDVSHQIKSKKMKLAKTESSSSYKGFGE